MRTGHKDGVTVRSARGVDADYVRYLSKKVFQQYGPYDEMLVGWFGSGTAVTLLALMGKRAVGFAMLGRVEPAWDDVQVSELLAVAVEPEKWKLGIGDLLMKEVERWAKGLRVETLVLHTAVDNLPGRKLFEKHGFSALKVKKGFYPEGQDALMMYKNI